MNDTIPYVLEWNQPDYQWYGKPPEWDLREVLNPVERESLLMIFPCLKYFGYL